ncbi:DNA polymerase Y family protein [Rubrolithibacter danxiaensis]|uniref:DNA polymerase Y family protein n=1 Tax=Rubrolithibacter danxiaensis TaxID=3390805 RepID=UPI003BF8C9D5
MNQNSLTVKTEPRVLFIDMNSFFARCEQQVNYWLRNRPVGVCVYTGKFGCIIAASNEAKLLGVKTGMRLNEAIKICPELVPVETNPDRYRNFHIKIIQVLKNYSQDIVPKSIDEAIINLENYKLIYPDPVEVAKKIKKDIYNEVGDWLSCSIGIAPNAFLAKLASGLDKRNGLSVITHENIDTILSGLKLNQLPGIGRNMYERLIRAGIQTPLQMRYAGPELLKRIFKSIEGIYWHYRLNFVETNIATQDYRGMQSMRQLSAENRKSIELVEQIFQTLCLTLEKRMVRHKYYCKTIGCSIKYTDNTRWDDAFSLNTPIQDGIVLLRMIKKRMQQFEQLSKEGPVLNTNVAGIRIGITNFINTEGMLYNLFEDIAQQEKARKTMYSIKGNFGNDKIMRAAELNGKVMKDVIGFGSVKDLTDLEYNS